jgi:hypothetical protein
LEENCAAAEDSGERNGKLEDLRPTNRHEQIRARPGQGDGDHVTFWSPEIARINRHGLGPAEQKTTRKECNKRHDHRANRIDMFGRIQSQAPEHLGGAVTELSCHPAVCNLVHRDSEQNRDNVNRQGLYKRRDLVKRLQRSIREPAILSEPVRVALALPKYFRIFAGQIDDCSRLDAATTTRDDNIHLAVQPLNNFFRVIEGQLRIGKQ